MNALYFTINSLSKVGYSDIIPSNNIEKIFSMVLNSFGLLILGYFIGQSYKIIILKFNKKKKFLK